jgi:hypothetical protein
LIYRKMPFRQIDDEPDNARIATPSTDGTPRPRRPAVIQITDTQPPMPTDTCGSWRLEKAGRTRRTHLTAFRGTITKLRPLQSDWHRASEQPRARGAPARAIFAFADDPPSPQRIDEGSRIHVSRNQAPSVIGGCRINPAGLTAGWQRGVVIALVGGAKCFETG